MSTAADVEIILRADNLEAVVRGVGRETFKQFAIAWLAENAARRETPSELIARLRIDYKRLGRRLAHPQCPAVDVDYFDRRTEGARRRVRWIHSTPMLDAFLTAGRSR